MMNARRPGRLPVLDATRGALASVVVMHHVVRAFGSLALARPAHVAVLGFFTMSGYVLAYSFDGRKLIFIGKRLIRLWPLYAVCVVAGCLIQGLALNPTWLAWWPMPPFQHGPAFDPPAWSLFMEAWATLIFPLLFWITLRNRTIGVAVAGLSFGLIFLDRGYSVYHFLRSALRRRGSTLGGRNRRPARLFG
jgi:peptidoglycan/LPS O-acetylase OafA/YrhL